MAPSAPGVRGVSIRTLASLSAAAIVVGLFAEELLAASAALRLEARRLVVPPEVRVASATAAATGVASYHRRTASRSGEAVAAPPQTESGSVAERAVPEAEEEAVVPELPPLPPAAPRPPPPPPASPPNASLGTGGGGGDGGDDDDGLVGLGTELEYAVGGGGALALAFVYVALRRSRRRAGAVAPADVDDDGLLLSVQRSLSSTGESPTKGAQQHELDTRTALEREQAEAEEAAFATVLREQHDFIMAHLAGPGQQRT